MWSLSTFAFTFASNKLLFETKLLSDNYSIWPNTKLGIQTGPV